MTKQKLFVSDFINNGIKGHQNYEFVDVAINDDNRLFLDPILIEFSTSTWCQSANKSIQSFSTNFIKLIRCMIKLKSGSCFLMHANKMARVLVTEKGITERDIPLKD